MITEENFDEEYERSILSIYGLDTLPEKHVDKLVQLRFKYIKGLLSSATKEDGLENE